VSALRLMWSLARFTLWHYLAAITLIWLNGYLFPLLPGLAVRELFNTLTGQATAGWNAETLLVLLATVGLMQAVTGVGGHVAELSLQVVASALLRRNMLERVLEQPGAQALPGSPGEAISRFRDDVRQVALFLSWTADPVGQILVFVLGVLVLARIDPALTLIVLILLAVVFVLGGLALRRLTVYRKANQEAIGEVTGLLGELFGAVLGVKVAGAERRVVEHLGVVNEVRRRAGVRDQVFSHFVQGISQNTANVGAGLLLLAGAEGLQSGRLTVGDFALFVSYLGTLAQGMSWVGVYLTEYRRARVSIDRAQEVMQGATPDRLVRHVPLYLRHGPPELPDLIRAEADQLGQLEARRLTYHHPGSDRGIKGIDLMIERGTITVITGRVGAGKTTLLRVLLGLLPWQDGEILWNGQVVDDPGRFLVPPRAAYTPQVPRLFSESLRDNLLMGLPDHGDRLERAVRAAVLERDLPTLEHGLDTLVGPRGTKLSGGQLQRAAAARMLVRTPELLVMDDLSSALDIETEAELWERLAEDGSRTILAVSHRRVALRRADQILVLLDGRVADTGKIEDLLARCEEMQALWHSVR
jgi:ATP-binding cassette, subfamily B, bacterial